MSPPKKIKLIALDVDGTLLDDAKRLPEANRHALQRAVDLGVRVAIASGRMTPTIDPIQDLLGIDCIVVAYNGGKVVTSRADGRRVIAHRPVPPAVSDRFIEFSQTHNYLLNFYHQDRLFAEDGATRRPFMDIYSRRTGARYEIEDLRRFRGVGPTKMILLADPGTRDRLHDELRSEYGAQAFITKSDPEYLEVMAPGVDKGAALADIAAHYGIYPDEVMAVGDADNDIGMLRAAGLGVAVRNARSQVQAAARVVTSRNNNEGAVAEAVERFVLT